MTPDSVVIQGELGAFSHSAALKLLGPNVRCIPKTTFSEAFAAIADGSADCGVIPIENTLYGSVHENYDHLVQFDLTICGETTLRIQHSLIARPELSLDNITRAFSHPVALDQCRKFFEQFPAIRPVPYYDTAGSVKMIMQDNPEGAAAIANEKAAELYGAQVLVQGIEDNSGNFTRFVLLTKQGNSVSAGAELSNAWKTSLVFTTANAPGALSRALNCFSSRDLNLSKLESRPLRNSPWEYLFYVDISGSLKDTSLLGALDDLRQLTGLCKVLGSYRPTL
jgi:prephenate dehydratase